MYNREAEYYNFIIKVFGYLNGRVNTFNQNCMLEIDLWTNYNTLDSNIAGDYSYPGLITVYLRAIINSITEDNINEGEEWIDHVIRCSIIDVVTHELLHADQNYDILRYSKDPEYAYDVEKDVIITAREFISSMIPELSAVFGFDVEATDYPHPSYEKLTNNYNRLSSRRDDYAKFMSAVFVYLGVRDDEEALKGMVDIYVSIMKWIDESDNVIISANGGSLVIKYYGEFLDNATIFNPFAYNYIFRLHRYLYISAEESNLRNWKMLSNEDAPCLSIVITSRIGTIAPAYSESK